MYALLELVSTLIELYIWVIIVSAILSWLIAFGIVDLRNLFIASLARFVSRLTEPVYAPLRRILPDLGGIDISPVVVILLLIFLRNLLWNLYNG